MYFVEQPDGLPKAALGWFGRLRIQLKLYDLFLESGSDSAGLGYRMSLKLTESEASHALVPSLGGFNKNFKASKFQEILKKKKI